MSSTIVIIGFFQALFFALLALAKKKKELADYILAGLFVIICYDLGVNYVLITDYKEVFPHLIGTAGPNSLLYGPFLYFFIKSYISERKEFRIIHLLHFLPFVLDHTYNLFDFYYKTGDEKIQMLEEILAGRPKPRMSIIMMYHSVSPLIYSIWCLAIINKHRSNLVKIYSYTSEKMKLDWLWMLTWSMFIVSILSFVITFIIVFFDIVDWLALREVIFIISTIWVFFIGYYSVRKTPFYRSYHLDGIDTLEDEPTAADIPADKYEKTKLKQEDIESIIDKLTDFLENDQPYLNKNLTIAELAESLGVPTHHLSQAINGHMGKSFFELINSYRVTEVQKRFFDKKYSNLTLLGIAMECGFNSKASFNRIFKQLTNQTPTEYIKAQQQVA